MKTSLASFIVVAVGAVVGLLLLAPRTEAASAGGHTINLTSHTFDGAYSTWNYDVTSGSGANISYWMLCWGRGDLVASASDNWTSGLDAASQFTGVKFSRGYAGGETRRISLRLQGDYAVGYREAMIAAGNTQLRLQVQGPVFAAAYAPNITVCQGAALSQQLFIDNCAGYRETGLPSPPIIQGIDYSSVNTAVPGDYPYRVTVCYACGCDSTVGTVTVRAQCGVFAPPITICQGTPLNDALFIRNGARCASGATPVIKYSFSTAVQGIYTYTVVDGSQCGSFVTATGAATVLPMPIVSAPNFTICQGTPVNDALFTTNGVRVIGDNCTMTLSYTFNSSATGTFSYTVSGTGPCGTVSGNGVVTVCAPPGVIAPPVTLSPGYTQAQLEAAISAAGGGCTSPLCPIIIRRIYDNGNGTYTMFCSNTCGVTSATGNINNPVTAAMVTATVPLNQGWNLVSLPRVPKETDIASLTSGADPLQIVTFTPPQRWWHYTRGVTLDLSVMNDGRGYWVYAISPGSLSYQAYQIPPAPLSYSLSSGWNMIGITGDTPRLYTDYLASIAGKYSHAFGFANGDFFLVGSPGHEQLLPGLGYWIAMTEPGTLTP